MIFTNKIHRFVNSIEMKVDRSGLGLSSESSKLNYDHFYQYLTNYKSDETATYDLVFSKEFDKDERKSLHEYGNQATQLMFTFSFNF